jgi:uncharacterized protein (TIGR02611 family)
MTVPGERTRPRWRDVVATTYRVIRANPTGRVALRIGVALLGAAVVALGLMLVPLPGPGWLIVLLGLSIWAIEFVWARHVLRFARLQLRRWTRWVAGRSWPVRLLLGLVGLAFVGVVVWASLKVSFGVDLWDRLWDYITTH